MATKEKSHSGANLSLPEIMWWELKKAVNKSMPENRNELKQHFKEEWAKIPSEECEWLIKSCRKHLLQVASNYWQ